MDNVYIISAAVIFLFMNLMYLLALRIKDNSIVDIGWGVGFILVVLINIVVTGNVGTRVLLISLLVICWGMRLAVYIFLRNKGKGEDYRYKQWREEWGSAVYLRSYLQIFMLQGVIMYIIALPLMLVIASEPTDLTGFDLAGSLLWLAGFLFEAVGDYQMMRFKNNQSNKGKIMRYGLWKYTRHPNYFGEALLWWGVFLIATGSGNILLAIISPVLLTFLLLKVSGVAMLEKKYKGNIQYEDYINSTSSFIPLPPRR